VTEKETARVAMEWPVDLKDQVREKVGPRGLTDFTIDAVRAKLATHTAHQAAVEELEEVKFLAQQLADAIALGGDYEDTAETLRLFDLPSWIETTGWSDELVAIVRDEDDYRPAHPPDRGPIRPVEDHELPAVGDPGTVRSAPPVAPKGDLLERVRNKAREKGVDLSGVDLRPATEIEAPPATNACPNCGSELVAGECWEC